MFSHANTITATIRAAVPPGTSRTVQTDPAETPQTGRQQADSRQTDSMAQKTILIVYAHQSKNSFNASACDVAVRELRAQGHKVIVSDLYAMNFKASATVDDITGNLKNPELFQYGEEAMHAWREDRLSDDIKAEQDKVREAELVIFQFPMYWFSVPAIMKGWIDRVLTQGFAFSLERLYNHGVLKEKKAMLSFSTGATQTMFRPDGINGDINVILWPLQNCTLHFCGFQVLAPQIFYSPAHSPPFVRTAMLDGWSARLKGLLEEKPLTFAPTEIFDCTFQGGFLVWPEVKEQLESQPFGLTTGHHLGKPLPPDDQVRSQPGHLGEPLPPDDQVRSQPGHLGEPLPPDNQVRAQPGHLGRPLPPDDQVRDQPSQRNAKADCREKDHPITHVPFHHS